MADRQIGNYDGLSGLGKVAAFGSDFNPLFQLGGGIIGGIGSAISKQQELDMQREKEEQRKREATRAFEQDKATTLRNQNMQGFNFLKNVADTGAAQRHDIFSKALTGGM